MATSEKRSWNWPARKQEKVTDGSGLDLSDGLRRVLFCAGSAGVSAVEGRVVQASSSIRLFTSAGEASSGV